MLTPADRDAPAWMRLRRHLAEELARLRALNDDSRLDAEKTARIRGRIFEIKRILALDGSTPAPDESP